MRRLYSLVCVAGGCLFLIMSLTACDDGPFGPSFPSGTADVNLIWDLTEENGSPVGSGVYLANISDGVNENVVKVVVAK